MLLALVLLLIQITLIILVAVAVAPQIPSTRAVQNMVVQVAVVGIYHLEAVLFGVVEEVERVDG
jgi:hypothetical protein